MPEPELPPLAEVIADGIPVDWGREASSGRISLEELQRFQSMEKVLQAHRRLFKEPSTSLTWGLSVPTEPLPPAAAPSSRIPQTWGNLQIRELVGRGGFGEVYRAFDPVLEREVALKLLKTERHTAEEARRRFLAEARRLARVRHDHVVIVHGADVRDGQMGIWTDFLNGTTLEELLRIQGPLSARETALIGIDLCRALAAVHGAGLVHRDVKTSNVMRMEGGRVVLFDFGMAAADRRGSGSVPFESVGGTPLYMAPEVLQGSAADPSADLYALGVLLYRLVSARYPIEAGSLKAIQKVHDAGTRTPLRSVRPDLPTEFVRIVEKAIAPLSVDRYASAGALEMDLAAFVGVPSLEQPWYLRPVTLIAGLAGAAILVVALFVSGMIAPTFSIGASLYKNETTEIFSGDTVSPGDHISLRLHLSRNARIVVLDQDPDGHLQRVFPETSDPGGATLEGDREHRLPPETEDVERSWTIGSTGGPESFVVLAAGSDRWWPWKRPSLPGQLEAALAQVPVGEENNLLAAIPESLGTGDGKAILESRRRVAGREGLLESLIQEAGAGRNVRIQRFDLNVEGR
jgi:eukaryotic-like serine/threonine-protein kinase